MPLRHDSCLSGRQPVLASAGEGGKIDRSVLIVDDDTGILGSLSRALGAADFDVRTAASADDALQQLTRENTAVALVDLKMPGTTGMELLKLLSERMPDIDVVMMTAYDDLATVAEAMQEGAVDFLVKPLDLNVLKKLLGRILEDRETRSRQGPGPSGSSSDGELVGHDPAMIQVFKLVGQVAATRTNVLVRGESGTGKELVARAIHRASRRADGPFVPVNCGAIPTELMESEFFGHRKGAFTGAVNDKAGLVQSADAGTLFLDEIADLPLAMQVKLLRVIQEKTIRPVGAAKEESVDIRILSATHKDLAKMVKAGQFREDLYYRINVIELHVPALRERGEDVLQLAGLILERLGSSIDNLDENAKASLIRYDFPGNVRELENMLERAVTLSGGGSIAEGDLAFRTSDMPRPGAAAGGQDLGNQIDEVQRQAIIEALKKTRYNKTAAAKLLGLTFRQLRYRIKKLGIE